MSDMPPDPEDSVATTKPKTVELADDYYLVNFRHLLSFVAAEYKDLLNNQESQYVTTLTSLSEPALRFYIRLLCRTKSLFRLDKLAYPEIGELDNPARELSVNGLLSINPELDTHTALALFTKPEIIETLSSLPGSQRSELRKLGREDLELHAIELLNTPEQLLGEHCILQTQDEELFDTFKLCFFGNLYQDMTEYVLRDLGLTQFESYSIDSETRAFSSRAQIDAHLEYYRCAVEAYELEPDDVEAVWALSDSLPGSPSKRRGPSKPQELSSPADAALQRRVDRLRNQLARDLERCGVMDDALKLFELSSRPPARERRARILAAGDRVDEALRLCEEILQTPYDDEEAQIIEAFSSRLAKKHKVEWPASSIYKPPLKKISIDDDGQSVEFQTAAWYRQYGECYYTENALYCGVFGLAFWDIMFAPIAGAFHNPFQSAPADFYEPEFHKVRKQLIVDRIKEFELNDETLTLEVTRVWNEKRGLQNSMVMWRYLSDDLLDKALQRIPVKHWLLIFDRLLGDLRHNRNGFPDLILFPDAGGYELIEVKGPGDTLQKNQKRWMKYFSDHDILHHVCHVEWASGDA